MGDVRFRFEPVQPGDPARVGPYELRARLGVGGMGRVFLAFTPAGRPIAVKVVKAELTADPRFHERFAREVEIAQRVDGRHAAQLLDADPHGRVPWLAQAYVAGPSLQELVALNGPLPVQDVLLIAVGVARGLQSIHAASAVHRDLKPSNVMLDEAGPQVIDFGIVKALEGSASALSKATQIGTPAYMSPEQAMGRAVGPGSDVFSLGSVVYFLATGALAFDAQNAYALMYRVINEQPDFARLPEPVYRVVMPCLEKDPARRPSPANVIELCLATLGGVAHGAYLRIAGAGPAIQARTEAVRELQPFAEGKEWAQRARAKRADTTEVDLSREGDPGDLGDLSGPGGLGTPANSRGPQGGAQRAAPGRAHGRYGLFASVAVACAALIGGSIIWAVHGIGRNDGADSLQRTSTSTSTSTRSHSVSAKPSSLTPFDPDSLGDAATDQTPLTAAALLPGTFSDSNGEYSLTFSGAKPCIAPAMLADVQNALTTNGCTNAMAGDYVGPGSSSANSDVVVFVQIYLFADTATALRAYDNLTGFYNTGGSFGYGYWCPASGIGAGLCSGPRSGFFSAMHARYRYIIEASGLYANGTTGYDAYQSAAVEAAINACGPNYYLQAFHSISPS